VVVVEGIIDFLKAPPIGALDLNLDPRGPYAAGDHQMSTWDGTHPVSSTYGLVWVATTVPVSWGSEIGFRSGPLNVNLDLYSGWILQVAAFHQALLGAWLADQVEQTKLAKGYLRWTEAEPGAVGIHVQPGWAFDLLWLKVL
jgi:hypothetical protein